MDLFEQLGFQKNNNDYSKEIEIALNPNGIGPIDNYKRKINITVKYLGEGFVSNVDDSNKTITVGYNVCNVMDIWGGQEDIIEFIRNSLKLPI